jgi:hypothetical protein
MGEEKDLGNGSEQAETPNPNGHICATYVMDESRIPTDRIRGTAQITFGNGPNRP